MQDLNWQAGSQFRSQFRSQLISIDLNWSGRQDLNWSQVRQDLNWLIVVTATVFPPPVLEVWNCPPLICLEIWDPPGNLKILCCGILVFCICLLCVLLALARQGFCASPFFFLLCFLLSFLLCFLRCFLIFFLLFLLLCFLFLCEGTGLFPCFAYCVFCLARQLAKVSFFFQVLVFSVFRVLCVLLGAPARHRCISPPSFVVFERA